MKSQQVRQVVFLGAALLIGVLGLIQALHEDAYAVGECSDVCTCSPSPCGSTVTGGNCSDDESCGGVSGTYSNCTQYCITQ